MHINVNKCIIANNFHIQNTGSQMKFLINILCVWIPIPFIRRRFRHALNQVYFKQQNKPNVLFKNTNKPYMLWFDHSLGGGTETYSKRQISKLKNNFEIIYIQYKPDTKLYHIMRVCNKRKIYTTPNISNIQSTLKNINANKIVVNNLVGYPNITEILSAIKNIATSQNNRPHISVRGHDFQYICPSFNLINCDGQYCNLRYKNGCEECWKQKIMSNNNIQNTILNSCATTIKQWRNCWGDFLENYADEIIVFSNSIKTIFISAYPNVADKICVIPHETQNLRYVNIQPHKTINIAILGNISHQKGADIVRKMSKHISKNEKIIIIGNMENPPDNIHIHGKYKTDDLPKLMEQYEIDTVFIPSIWPETFSYTTSEATSMGLPVICYDLGAPAERITQYKYGLVLKEITPDKNWA